MLITIVILVVAGISLYEYLSSRTWQQVTSTERNDIVFEERNLEYGAYQIRKNYSRNLLLVMAGVILFIGTTFGIYKLIMNLPQEKPKEVPLDLTAFAVDAPMDKEEIIEPLEPEIPPMEKTIQFLPPVVTDDEVDTPPATVDELQDTKASTMTNENEGDPFAKIDPTPPKPKEEKVEKKEEIIYDIVDENADFPGGRAALLKYLSENIKYPQTAVEMGIQGKSYLQFVVSENGFISNVKVKKGVTDCPECDQEAIRVIKGMPKWTPGKVNGKAVNSTFSLPVSFKLN
ncbi:energy transducer TonB [Fluviicola sp.]|jgi:protein TonB|uniref:energy transducer TonB n=1 Tax=Fluviicola sp. TaxID=1917219 RepID=UPI002822ECDB|nr:energy transducer TonB [Fluviicola sp.]MDR0801333.1 energy transducer TonB [Fluviicola sp.]